MLASIRQKTEALYARMQATDAECEAREEERERRREDLLATKGVAGVFQPPPAAKMGAPGGAHPAGKPGLGLGLGLGLGFGVRVRVSTHPRPHPHPHPHPHPSPTPSPTRSPTGKRVLAPPGGGSSITLGEEEPPNYARSSSHYGSCLRSDMRLDSGNLGSSDLILTSS